MYQPCRQGSLFTVHAIVQRALWNNNEHKHNTNLQQLKNARIRKYIKEDNKH